MTSLGVERHVCGCQQGVSLYAPETTGGGVLNMKDGTYKREFVAPVFMLRLFERPNAIVRSCSCAVVFRYGADVYAKVQGLDGVRFCCAKL